MTTKPKVLLICYDIHPMKGGESSVAWNIFLSLRSSYNITILTRSNNILPCKHYISENYPNYNNYEFIGYDINKSLLSLKRRFPFLTLPYCILWQYFIPYHLRSKLNAYDVVHSVNFVSDTIPVFSYKFNSKIIWGPISHHEPLPNFLSGRFSRYSSLFVMLIRRFFWFILNFKKRFSKFDIVLFSNYSVVKRLGYKENFIYFSSTGFSTNNTLKLPQNKNDINLLYIARFVPIKGWDVIFETIRYLLNSNVKHNLFFKFVGDGPEFNSFSLKIKNLKLPSNIKIILYGKLEYVDVLKLYNDTDIYLCPSFEGGGVAVAEAMSYSLPVVCFDNYGPGETVGGDYPSLVKYNHANYDNFISFTSEVKKLISDYKYRSYVANYSYDVFRSRISWSSKSVVLQDIYNKLLE